MGVRICIDCKRITIGENSYITKWQYLNKCDNCQQYYIGGNKSDRSDYGDISGTRKYSNRPDDIEDV